MDQNYTFTMSNEDQEKFVSIERGSKYGDLLRGIKQKLESENKQVNFKEQSSSKFVLSQIDQKMMKETIAAFPVDLPLNDKNIFTYSQAQVLLQAAPNRIYDVRFVMPLLYHAVSPSLFVDCRDFIARRCLALTIIGLSSEDPQMRALCYKILERYYEHLLSALLIDKQLWINFLDLLRNSIPNPNAKLKFIFVMFLSKIIDILLHPNDKMYDLVKEFLAGRPKLKIDTIEIYHNLLLCSDVDLYDHHLRWLVTLFRDGLRTDNDLKVLPNLNVISQVMCLYNSALRFERANETICSMFIRIASIKSGSTLLANTYSFLPWLHQVILYHMNQDPEEFRNDPKSESLADTVRNITSLVFAFVDALIKGSESESMTLPRLLELCNVFMALHDFIIKAKSPAVLEQYLGYVLKVAKAVRKDKRIPDQIAVHLLELIKAKMPYLT